MNLDETGPQGVGGWLLVLCVLLTALPVRGISLGVLLRTGLLSTAAPLIVPIPFTRRAAASVTVFSARPPAPFVPSSAPP